MKRENNKSPKKGNLADEDRWVNVHDDDVMRAMGFFRPFNQAPRDENVWTKTPYEKRLLKKLRHTYKGKDTHFHSCPHKIIRVYGKLVINLCRNKNFSKSTYSTKCWQHEIPDILAKYQIVNPKTNSLKSIVKSYSWNGKTYNSRNLPPA